MTEQFGFSVVTVAGERGPNRSLRDLSGHPKLSRAKYEEPGPFGPGSFFCYSNVTPESFL